MNLKRLVSTVLFVSLMTCLLQNISYGATTDEIKAGSFVIPYSWQGNEFGYQSYEKAAFIVEFNGAGLLKYASCGDFISNNGPIFATVSTHGRELRAEVEPGGFIHELGITKSGVKCAIEIPSNFQLFGDGPAYLYKPAESEEKVPVTVSLGNSTATFGTGEGFFYNPDYAPAAPQIIGLSRGDTVSGIFQFKLSGTLPTGLKFGDGNVLVCPVNESDCVYGKKLGGGLLDQDGKATVWVNANATGQAAEISVGWPYKNSFGDIHEFSTSVLVQIGNSPYVGPWSALSKFTQDLALQTGLQCPNYAKGGSILTCTVNPIVISAGSNGHISDGSLIATNVEFTVIDQIDSGSWKQLQSFKAPTDKNTTFTIQVPANWHRFSLNVVNSVLKQAGDESIISYGKLPPGSSIIMHLPDFVYWGTSYPISATATSGKLTSCIFSTGGKSFPLVYAKNGIASIAVTSVWAGEVGSSTNIYVTASCVVSGKTITGASYVRGYR